MDSTKVEIVSQSFDKLVKKLTESKANPIWDTLTPLLIGAGLTLASQFFIEFLKSKKEAKRKKQELISKGMAKTYLIAQILKDLAMYKVHKQYYIRAFQLATDPAEKEDCFKKHYDKGQEQRVVKATLDDAIAEYFQLVTEYSTITGNKDHFAEHFKKVFEYDNPTSTGFENCTSMGQLRPHLVNEEMRLNEVYSELGKIFVGIQKELK